MMMIDHQNDDDDDLFSPSLEWRVNTRLLRHELRKKMTPHSRIPVAFCEKKLGPCDMLRKKMTPHSRIPVAVCEKKLGPYYGY